MSLQRYVRSDQFDTGRQRCGEPDPDQCRDVGARWRRLEAAQIQCQLGSDRRIQPVSCDESVGCLDCEIWDGVVPCRTLVGGAGSASGQPDHRPICSWPYHARRAADQQSAGNGAERDRLRMTFRRLIDHGNWHRAAYRRMQAEQGQLGRVGRIGSRGEEPVTCRVRQCGAAGQANGLIVACHQHQRRLMGPDGSDGPPRLSFLKPATKAGR